MFYLAQHSKSELGRLIIEVTRSHTLFDTKRTQEMTVHALSGIRTGDPNNQAAADLRLRQHGNRVCFILFTCCLLHTAVSSCQVIYEGWNFNSGNYLFTTDTK